MHSFDWPNDSAQHNEWKKGSECQICRASFIIHGTRNHEACKKQTFIRRGFARRKNQKNKPKHMPHNPVSTTSSITHNNSPRNVNSNTEKLKIRTRVVWKHITRNCVVTCDARISIPVTPDTRHRSKIPSFRSINMAPDVRATDKKKIMLERRKKLFSYIRWFDISPLYAMLEALRRYFDDSLYLLQRNQFRLNVDDWLKLKTYVNWTPGAAKSVKLGIRSP